MLKEYATVFRRFMMVVDIIIAAGSCYLAYYVATATKAHLAPVAEYTVPIMAMVVIWSVGLYYSGMYLTLRFKKASDIIFIIYQSAYIGFLVFAGFCYLVHIHDVSRAFIILSYALTGGIIAIEKLVLISFFRHLRRKGLNHRNVLVIGTGTRAKYLIKTLEDNKEMGLRVIGILDQDKAQVGQVIHNHPVIGTIEDLPRITRENVVDQVFFVVPRSWVSDMEQPLLYLERLGIRVDFAVDYFNLALTRAKQSEFFGIPFLSIETAPDRLIPLLIKRFMDLVLSGIALILLSPLLGLTALLIKLGSPGPVFFVQKRVSMNGRIFDLYKFRTMVLNAEAKLDELKHLNEMQGPVFKITNDPRVTPIGKYLRKASIDELPQLWNVFVGHMSLVGPRPPLPSEVVKYDDWQRRRLSLRPGITCLWQIGGRNRITDFDEWIRLDLKYIDNWSLWLDIRILCKTVPVVLFGIGAK